jgi:ubiquinone/menaquinone biosynthesis C-methylase UbiE
VGQSLLDVGCGTGYFSQCFQQSGLEVTGLDPDSAMIEFAKTKESQVKYIEGDVLALPFTDNSFDYCSAITSLCFVAEPEKAISEMLRVSRHGVILGLLNRHGVLHKQKKHSASYRGARWDTVSEIKQWCRNINPDMKIVIKSAVLIPSAGIIARTLEKLLPDYFPYASFLAVKISDN